MNLKHILIAVVVMFLFLPDLYAQRFEAKELNGVLYQRLQNEGTDGGHAEFTAFRGLRHREACDKAISKKRLEGMFSHRKQGRVKLSLF